MSVETLRWLDRWVGIPLCFLVSMVARFNRGHRAAIPTGMPRAVMCIQLAEMGSLVLMGPTMHWLRSQGVIPALVSFSRNRDCATMAGLVTEEHLFLWRTENPLLFSIDLVRFIVWSWRSRFDAAIDFEPCSRLSVLLCLLARTRLRAGYIQAEGRRDRLLNRPVRYREDRHMGENFLALAAAVLDLDIPADVGALERGWRKELQRLDGSGIPMPNAGVKFRQFLHDETTLLIAINPNAGDLIPQRRWPTENYVTLARRLLDYDRRIKIVMIGATCETETVASIVSVVDSPRCISLAGELTVGDLPGLFVRSRLFVTNDSGPAHIAALTGTPTVVMFGPETPGLYRPLGNPSVLYAELPCSPCIRIVNQRRCSCDDNICMKAISVDAVLARIARILADEIAIESP